MAETERTFAELQTLLADNTTKAISPQDLRDAVVSALGGYASIYADGNATPQAILATATLLAAFSAAGPSRGATGDHANDKLVAGVAGVYALGLVLCMTADAPDVCTVRLYADDVELDGLAQVVAVGADAVSVSICGLATLSAGADIDVRLSCAGGPRSVTVTHAHLSTKRVG